MLMIGCAIDCSRGIAGSRLYYRELIESLLELLKNRLFLYFTLLEDDNYVGNL